MRREAKVGNNFWSKKGTEGPGPRKGHLSLRWKGDRKLHSMVDFQTSPWGCSLSIYDVSHVCRLPRQPSNRIGSQGHQNRPHTQGRGTEDQTVSTPSAMTTWLLWNGLQRKGWARRRPDLDFRTGKQPALARIHFWSHF